MAQDRSVDDELTSTGVSGQQFETRAATAETTGDVATGRSYLGLVAVAVGVVSILVLLMVLSGSDAGSDAALPATSTTPESTITIPPATTTATAPTTVTAPPTTLVPGVFLLGEPTGLWLFYGGADPLQRLDLDSGERIEYGLQALPIAATGDDLVLHQEESGVSGWVLAADPGEQALNWKRGPVAPADEPGLLWVLDPSTSMDHPAGVTVGFGRWQLFDLAANRVLDRRPGDLYDEIEANVDADGARFRSVGPDYSNRPDGVYRYNEDGYRRIAEGRAVAVDGSKVLVTTCAAGSGVAEACAASWIDGQTGAVLDDPVPDGNIGAATLSNGRLLLSPDNAGAATLFELDSGETSSLEDLDQPVVSPDGRWLAGFAEDTLIIRDLLGRQQPMTYGEFSREGGGNLLFVARS